METDTRPTLPRADALTLISHPLCPYVQRAVIALTEKGVPFERIDIDLADKPAWFLEISPLGKTPVLRSGGRSIFESAVILEYLEETRPHPLHPAAPLVRADHRSWIEVGSAILSDIAGLYTAGNATLFEAKRIQLAQRFARVEDRLVANPWFDGPAFSLVDAAFGPIFRYFDTFDQIVDLGILAQGSKTARWRRSLSDRPSIRTAVATDYDRRLRAFLRRRGSHLSRLMTDGPT